MVAELRMIFEITKKEDSYIYKVNKGDLLHRNRRNSYEGGGRV